MVLEHQRENGFSQRILGSMLIYDILLLGFLFYFVPFIIYGIFLKYAGGLDYVFMTIIMLNFFIVPLMAIAFVIDKFSSRYVHYSVAIASVTIFGLVICLFLSFDEDFSAEPNIFFLLFNLLVLIGFNAIAILSMISRQKILLLSGIPRGWKQDITLMLAMAILASIMLFPLIEWKLSYISMIALSSIFIMNVVKTNRNIEALKKREEKFVLDVIRENYKNDVPNKRIMKHHLRFIINAFLLVFVVIWFFSPYLNEKFTTLLFPMSADLFSDPILFMPFLSTSYLLGIALIIPIMLIWRKKIKIKNTPRAMPAIAVITLFSVVVLSPVESSMIWILINRTSLSACFLYLLLSQFDILHVRKLHFYIVALSINIPMNLILSFPFFHNGLPTHIYFPFIIVRLCILLIYFIVPIFQLQTTARH
ncbi:MAG: hypothetical protein ACTSUE_14125 [Promethearchaeota archaeon]